MALSTIYLSRPEVSFVAAPRHVRCAMHGHRNSKTSGDPLLVHDNPKIPME